MLLLLEGVECGTRAHLHTGKRAKETLLQLKRASSVESDTARSGLIDKKEALGGGVHSMSDEEAQLIEAQFNVCVCNYMYDTNVTRQEKSMFVCGLTSLSDSLNGCVWT